MAGYSFENEAKGGDDMARPYGKLRGLMREYDITNEILAKYLLLGVDAVSKKLNNRSQWTQEQMYAILDLFKLPDHRLHEIFPRNGQNEAGAYRRTIAKKAG